MKKVYLLLLMILTLVPAYSQEKGKKSREEMHKEYREYKMKVLAQEMDLRDDQQKEFFDLYNKMSDERHKVHHEFRQIKKKMQDEKNMSEEDYAKLNTAEATAREKDSEIDKRYDAKFKKILTAKQIYKMKEVEEQFRNKIREMHLHKNKNKGKK